MDKVVVVVGPTASGKSDLSIKLSKKVNAEIINADSRQIYSLMDIGTAKPTPQQLETIQHYLVSIRDPDYNFNVMEFKDLCKASLQKIINKNKVPILCGGSGQYIYSVIQNWSLGKVPPDPEFRQAMHSYAERYGAEKLFARLKTIDPLKAASIDYRNIPRVIRALEIVNQPSPLVTEADPFFDNLNFLIVGVTQERSLLYSNIDHRVDQMIANGFLEEVQSLLNKGFPPTLRAFNSPGYRELISYTTQDITWDDAVSKIKTKTHTLARKQYNWFKPNDHSIHWFDSSTPNYSNDVHELVATFLKS